MMQIQNRFVILLGRSFVKFHSSYPYQMQWHDQVLTPRLFTSEFHSPPAVILSTYFASPSLIDATSMWHLYLRSITIENASSSFK